MKRKFHALTILTHAMLQMPEPDLAVNLDSSAAVHQSATVQSLVNFQTSSDNVTNYLPCIRLEVVILHSG